MLWANPFIYRVMKTYYSIYQIFGVSMMVANLNSDKCYCRAFPNIMLYTECCKYTKHSEAVETQMKDATEFHIYIAIKLFN